MLFIEFSWAPRIVCECPQIKTLRPHAAETADQSRHSKLGQASNKQNFDRIFMIINIISAESPWTPPPTACKCPAAD